jgi:hypothetical protein
MERMDVRALRGWTNGLAKQSAGALLIHLSALFSYCGGPLFAADLTKPELGAKRLSR